jgi:hypothetical protein
MKLEMIKWINTFLSIRCADCIMFFSYCGKTISMVFSAIEWKTKEYCLFQLHLLNLPIFLNAGIGANAFVEIKLKASKRKVTIDRYMVRSSVGNVN